MERQTNNPRRRSRMSWEKGYDRLLPVAEFVIIARRILVLGLMATFTGIVLNPFGRFSGLHLIGVVFFLICAWICLEMFWKCYCAHCVGAARGGWMKERSALVALADACDQLTTCVPVETAGKTDSWIASVSETIMSISGHARDVVAGVNSIDDTVRKMEDAIGGPFSTVDSPNSPAKLPKIWEKLGAVLSGKVRRECFDPAFNEMLERYVRARKFLGKDAVRWLALGFTAYTIFIVLDCLRVMLQSGASQISLSLLPDAIRNWWRRQ